MDHAGSLSCGLALLYAQNSRYLCSRDSLSSATDSAWFSAHDGLEDNHRGNPGAAAKISDFQSDLAAALAAAIDVAMFKFCYIDSPLGDQCASLDSGQLFAQVKAAMEGLEASYPGVTFVWWTMPIETSPNAERQAYNDLVRSYCSVNGEWLLDIADIESHYDSDSDGVDDSAATSGSYEILYTGYTSDGGHLNDAGKLKLAKAYWKLLAAIAKAR